MVVWSWLKHYFIKYIYIFFNFKKDLASIFLWLWIEWGQRYSESVCFRPATDFDLALLNKLSWNIATKPRQPLCIAFEKQIECQIFPSWNWTCIHLFQSSHQIRVLQTSQGCLWTNQFLKMKWFLGAWL